MTPGEQMLVHIDRGMVTWRRHGSRRPSYRLWANDDSYVIVTREVHALIASGHAKQEMAAGYGFTQFGPVELTAAGLTLLQSGSK